ncbi:hypothetical protein INR49_008428 [Caranx melampygus]|nr:hypothetical protein INR49_008428 [Caranx melampygus]
MGPLQSFPKRGARAPQDPPPCCRVRRSYVYFLFVRSVLVQVLDCIAVRKVNSSTCKWCFDQSVLEARAHGYKFEAVAVETCATEELNARARGILEGTRVTNTNLR